MDSALLWLLFFLDLSQGNGCEKVYPSLAEHSHRDLLRLNERNVLGFKRYFTEVVLTEEVNKLKTSREGTCLS